MSFHAERMNCLRRSNPQAGSCFQLLDAEQPRAPRAARSSNAHARCDFDTSIQVENYVG